MLDRYLASLETIASEDQPVGQPPQLLPRITARRKTRICKDVCSDMWKVVTFASLFDHPVIAIPVREVMDHFGDVERKLGKCSTSEDIAFQSPAVSLKALARVEESGVACHVE